MVPCDGVALIAGRLFARPPRVLVASPVAEQLMHWSSMLHFEADIMKQRRTSVSVAPASVRQCGEFRGHATGGMQRELLPAGDWPRGPATDGSFG